MNYYNPRESLPSHARLIYICTGTLKPSKTQREEPLIWGWWCLWVVEQSDAILWYFAHIIYLSAGIEGFELLSHIVYYPLVFHVGLPTEIQLIQTRDSRRSSRPNKSTWRMRWGTWMRNYLYSIIPSMTVCKKNYVYQIKLLPKTTVFWYSRGPFMSYIWSCVLRERETMFLG